MKIIAMGFLIGPDCYLRHYWNMLDFIGGGGSDRPHQQQRGRRAQPSAAHPHAAAAARR